MSARAFTSSDQRAFALLSGDFNPLHLDPLRARKTFFGRPIVHGIHLLLMALESVTDRSSRNLSRCKASFKKGVGVEEPYTLRVTRQETSRCEMEIRVFGSLAAKFLFEFDDQVIRREVKSHVYAEDDAEPESPEELSGRKGSMELGFDAERLKALFPNLALQMSPHQVGSVLATTRLVGMVCPGMNSVYSGMEMRYANVPEPREIAGDSEGFHWQVASTDERFGLVDLKVEGQGFEGEIEALVRPAPVEQPSSRELKGRVRGMDFGGRRCLIIGGSRGLGEICSKILALGGAEVLLTYNQGREEGARVVEDIRAEGGVARCEPYNVIDPPSDMASMLGGEFQPTELYYFATPPLIVGDKYGFSFEVYEKYRRFYVDGFVKLVLLLKEESGDQLRCVYPSSVAVEETPAGWAEYAAAKAEGEAMCRYLQGALRNTTIESWRLPRIMTDLTATAMPVDSADPVEALSAMLKGRES